MPLKLDPIPPFRGGPGRSSNGASVQSENLAGVGVKAALNSEQVPSPSHSRGPSDVSPNRRPRTLGEYAITKTLGAGSMGKVKLGISQINNEKVAIKIIPRTNAIADPPSGQSPTASYIMKQTAKNKSKEIRTVREAAICELLFHPYIAGCKELITFSNHYFMIFEYVSGGQLLDYIISHGRLRERQARKFARQIGSALDYCHKNNLVHRDLKIENILISATGNIKIIDFGLSNTWAPDAQLSTFCGSLYFAAPELLNARVYTGPEVDVWSFGIVLYVLVCGKVPFDDQSMPALHAKIKRGHVEYPHSLSTECKHVLSRMLVTTPSNRAALSEVLSHQWMMKGYDGSANSHLPSRDPLHEDDIDPRIIEGMAGFELGTSLEIETKLREVLASSAYHEALELWTNFKEGRTKSTSSPPATPMLSTPASPTLSVNGKRDVSKRFSGLGNLGKKMLNVVSLASSPTKPHGGASPSFGFDSSNLGGLMPGFSNSDKRQSMMVMPSSATSSSFSRYTIKTPDPNNPAFGFNPLISIYFLVRERIGREKIYGKGVFASSTMSLLANNITPSASASASASAVSKKPSTPTCSDVKANTTWNENPERSDSSPLRNELQKPLPIAPGLKSKLDFESLPNTPLIASSSVSRSAKIEDAKEQQGEYEVMQLGSGVDRGTTHVNRPIAHSDSHHLPRVPEPAAHRRTDSTLSQSSPTYDAPTNVMPVIPSPLPGLNISKSNNQIPNHHPPPSAPPSQSVFGNPTSPVVTQRGALKRLSLKLSSLAVDDNPLPRIPDEPSDKIHIPLPISDSLVSPRLPSQASPTSSRIARRFSALISRSASHRLTIDNTVSNAVKYQSSALDTDVEYLDVPGKISESGNTRCASFSPGSLPKRQGSVSVLASRLGSMGRNVPSSLTKNRDRRPSLAATVGGMLSREGGDKEPETPLPDGIDHGMEGASENIKPVWMKGLFSVTTTTTKPVTVIRRSILTALQNLGVQYREVTGGFECVKHPSIVEDSTSRAVGANSPSRGPSILRHKKSQHSMVEHSGSIVESEEDNGFEDDKSRIPLPIISSKSSAFDQQQQQYNNAKPSVVPPPSDQSELMTRFDITIVKVPWLPGIHGLQFRRTAGDAWRYHQLAKKVLDEVKF